MRPLDKKYNHKEAEHKWQQEWVESKTYAWEEDQPRDNTYVIDTPPPTVSGLLHMGHIFSYTQADFVARFQRMNGKTVFYPMGFDDNGLPTERLVEKVKKVRARDMSREEFITLCETVGEEARHEFRRLFQSVALSVDWDQEYHTVSERSRRLSQLSFLDLYNKELAYRSLQPMLWDPVDQTAIAQAEVEDKEFDSHMNEITFTTEEGEPIVIATTRPELLPACVAVFYHPDDERYQKLAGKKAITAIFGVKVDILPDEEVKMDKGTGLVMCCTFGDETDINWWHSHKLPLRQVLNKYGKLNIQVAESKDLVKFQSDHGDASGELNSDNCVDIKKTCELLENLNGMKTKDARAHVIELVEQAGLLVEREAITHAVKCAERSGATLEIIPTNQWFIKVLDKKKELKDKAQTCNWYPQFMRVRVEQWIDGLNWDWCISRQRYFGVPFPIWYSKRPGEEGKIIIADKDQLPVNPLVDLPEGYSRDEVEAEADVMDTWATSSVSPQLNSHGITDGYAVDLDRHKKLFPADLRPQAHEIIRTWAFYTIAKAHLHEDTIPWKDLMISGWCLAADKTKMSKSKGNVVTPVDLIEEKGADVVRYWASTSHLGADTAYSEDVLKIGKKLVNKIWNATKFAATHLENLSAQPGSAAEDVEKNIIYEPLDLWILTRLHRTIVRATETFDIYEYCRAREAIEDFFWNDFCDNYLELVKGRAYAESGDISKEAQQSAIHTLYHCLEGLLRLFAPFVPHITEELYSHIFEEEYQELGSIHGRGRWPVAHNYPVDEAAEKSGKAAVAILDVIRRLKADKNVSIKWPLTNISVAAGEQNGTYELIKPLEHDLCAVSNAAELTWADSVSEGTTTEDQQFSVAVEFAEESDKEASGSVGAGSA